ncbi:MAG TPA: PilZ domain-containing protein [Thermodesulfobacteriota bacterium]|nr:PilZ domain-containing protein [Thermodesulfobacteriota bacterium]
MKNTEIIYDQRTSERFPLITKIVILLNSGENIIASTFNVSDNGVGMNSNLDIPVGTKIRARIYLEKETLGVNGQIKWSSKNPDSSFDYGIQLNESIFYKD